MGKKDSGTKVVTDATGNETATAELQEGKKKKKKDNAAAPDEDAEKTEGKKGGKSKNKKQASDENPAERKQLLQSIYKTCSKTGDPADGKKKEKKKKSDADQDPKEEANKKRKKGESEQSKDDASPEGKKKLKKDKPAAESATEVKEKKRKQEKQDPAESSKKAKKEKEKGDKEETEKGTESKKEKKGKKGKGKKETPETDGETDTETTKTDTQTESETGKKGKKKGKGKKSRQLNVQESIRAFLTASQMFDDDEWTWESYTPSEESVKQETPKKEKKGKKKEKEEAPPPKEKKGKGKGKKKEKEPKVEEAAKPVEEAEPVDDIMAQIKLMKALAEAQLMGVDESTAVEEVPVKKKPKKPKKDDAEKKKEPKEAAPAGPKKKLTPKEKAALKAQKKLEKQLAKEAAAEAERLRIIEEMNAAIRRENQEAAEQQLRTEQLGNTLRLIAIMHKKNNKKAICDRETKEWEDYLKCDGLPNAYICSQLTTYLHVWQKEIQTMTIDQVGVRSSEALDLLKRIKVFISDPVGATPTQIENWKWLERLFREYQQTMLDTSTYRLIRDSRTNLVRLDLTSAEFRRKEKDFALYLWLPLGTPKSMHNSRAPVLPRISAEIPEMTVNLLFPKTIHFQDEVVRMMYRRYDHVSDFCATYWEPPMPDLYAEDIKKTVQREWNLKLLYKYVKSKNPEGEDPTDEEMIIDTEDGTIPAVPYQKLKRTASAYYLDKEDEEYLKITELLVPKLEEHVVNLREYVVLGGIYSLEVFCQPPQPHSTASYNLAVSRLQLPKGLFSVPVYIDYEPAKVPPELEKEDQILKFKEADIDQLMLISMKLADNILWFEIPIVCQWNDSEQYWTTQDIWNLKYIEKEKRFTFRTGKFGHFTTAMHKFINMPFKSWYLRNEADGTIVFKLTAAIISIEFKIKEDLVCATKITNIPKNSLNDIIGVYYVFPRLLKKLRARGVDIFPELDTFCYVEGACAKNWPVEKHLYYNIAQLCRCFNFEWSHWNKTAGRRNIVLQIKEYKSERLGDQPAHLLLVTPLKAIFLQCTEDSEEFNLEPAEDMKFYSDLYHLIKGTTRMAIKNKIQNTSPVRIGIVAQILIATKVLSFC